MSEEDAKYHMKRCVDSGLWVPDANKSKDEDGKDGSDAPEPADAEKVASKQD